MKGTKWLLAGSVVFFAFACQSNSGNGKCSPCNGFKKCAPNENGETRPGRCRDRPCGENAASDLIQQKDEAVSKVIEAEVPQTVEAETVKAEEPAAPAVVETPAVSAVVEETAAPAAEAPAPVAAVESAAPEAPAATEISAAAN